MDVGLLAKSPVARQPRRMSAFSRQSSSCHEPSRINRFSLKPHRQFQLKISSSASTAGLWSAHRCSSFVEERSRNTRGARPTIIQRKGVMGRFDLSATAMSHRFSFLRSCQPESPFVEWPRVGFYSWSRTLADLCAHMDGRTGLVWVMTR